MLQPHAAELAKLSALARVIKEEAMAGETDCTFLIWQLASAVEDLASVLTAAAHPASSPRGDGSQREQSPAGFEI